MRDWIKLQTSFTRPTAIKKTPRNTSGRIFLIDK
nr:MAG TPA: hypothetical protein [Caudoviricetes sp.]